MKKIKMLDSTFDSNKKKLPRDEEFKVSDDEKVENAVSTADATILIEKGMAKEVEAKKPAAKKAATKKATPKPADKDRA